MSIAIITASQAPQRHANGLPREVVSQLVERASRAGRTVAVCGCRDVADVIECVRRARGSGPEFLLTERQKPLPRPLQGLPGPNLDPEARSLWDAGSARFTGEWQSVAEPP